MMSPAEYWLLILIASGITFGAISCSLDTEAESAIPFGPDIHNASQQRVLNLQDRQETDSILPYFQSPDPNLRYRAALAMASIRDSSGIHLLGQLLEDPVAEVRAAAAFALGQSGAAQAEDILTSGFDALDSTGRYSRSNAAILEAVGKTGGSRSVGYLSTASTYSVSDTMLLLGQARGLYRFGLRGLTSEASTSKMVELLTTGGMPENVRLVAANYLMRARGIDLTGHLDVLISLMTREQDPLVRMCLPVAVCRNGDGRGLRAVNSLFSKEKDYRVRCNIIRSLEYYNYSTARQLAFEATNDQSVHVARLAAEYFVGSGTRADAQMYRAMSRGRLPWEVKVALYEASEKYLPAYYTITKTNMLNELRSWFDRASNPMEKAAVLKAIGAEPKNFEVVHELGMDSPVAAVRTSCIGVMADILAGNGASSTLATGERRRVFDYLRSAISNGDVAMVAVAAEAMTDPGVKDWAQEYVDDFIVTLGKLRLPEHVETYNILAETIADLKGESFERRRIAFNHPVDWELVNSLSDTVKAEIVTSRGAIVVDLYTGHTPATVANFVKLTRDGFFSGKIFHRVVPNFVIQGGCPRGDGYGSLDYTIRSELLPLYYDDEGYLGMASAGNHTESTQWFVTHSPTPHLDGNYTIFGKVMGGMEVVHEIQPGDEIRQVNLVN